MVSRNGEGFHNTVFNSDKREIDAEGFLDMMKELIRLFLIETMKSLVLKRVFLRDLIIVVVINVTMKNSLL